MNVNKYIENNTNTDESEKIIIEFGLNMMAMTIVALIVAILISIFLDMLLEGLLLLISIIVLRQYSGGYHASSQKVCAVLSCIIYSVGLMIIKNLALYNGIQLAICVVAAFIIFFCLLLIM